LFLDQLKLNSVTQPTVVNK